MKYILVSFLLIASVTLYAQHDIPPTSEFEIKGLVKMEMMVRISDLAKYKQDSLGNIVVKNKKGEEKGILKHLKGVLLKSVIDSAGIVVEKPKEYSELSIILTASDNYKNVYSWNELYNTEVGNHVYIITETDGKPFSEVPGRILVISMSDYNSGSRHLKGLATIEIKKIH